MHKVSPVIESGAYPAKAVVGVHTDPSDGVPRRPRRSQRLGCAAERHRAPRTDASHTPLGFDWWTASVVLDTEGCGRTGSRAGAILGRPGCTTPKSRSRPASTSSWCAPKAGAVRKVRCRRRGGRRRAERRAAARCGQQPEPRTASGRPVGGRACRRGTHGDGSLRSPRADLAHP